eukprot:TRINITY_DN34111_c0_g1_i1.p3 TRINITY_DN34111_c0_g1~~TRINITY_DN34111_c0_g1_i1.p3  ORF type:complete len:121 (+),score=30.11 TRINITY_DN34111_c0_g1_i1:292-654(+)
MLAPEQLSALCLDPHGRFLGSEEFVLGSSGPPAPGRVLTFFQNIVHEGCPPVNGTVKYIIRTDIMYERRPALCDTAQDKQAYELYLQAKESEAEGRTEQAVQLYKRMIKLSPGLADVYGL